MNEKQRAEGRESTLQKIPDTQVQNRIKTIMLDIKMKEIMAKEIDARLPITYHLLSLRNIIEFFETSHGKFKF